jgi:hypothetical protein
MPFLQAVPLPSKVLTVWYKTFELCESSTGYVWSFTVYTGKNTEIQSHLISSGMNKISVTVMKLAEPLINKGYTI